MQTFASFSTKNSKQEFFKEESYVSILTHHKIVFTACFDCDDEKGFLPHI